jgi:hypothetical protein
MMIFVEALLVFAIIALIWMLVTMVIFKKLNKTRIKGVALIFLAFVAVAIVIIIMGHFLEWHETNEFCGEMCHAMEGPYNSYTQPKNNSFMRTHYESDVPCAQCHSGPGFVGLGTSFLPVPKEMLGEYITGYDPDDFGGHVPSENCLKGCHEDADVDWKFEGPMPKGEGYFEVDGEGQWQLREIYHPYTKNGTDLKELRDIEICQDCHDPRDNSFGLAKDACTLCHDIEPDELLAHSLTTYQGEGGEEPPSPKLTGHNTVEDNCMVCHNRDHPDDALVRYDVPLLNSLGRDINVNASFCADCHQEAYNEVSTFNSKHYTENDCTDCHLEHKTRPDCLLCHDLGSEFEPEHTIASPFDECAECHVQGGHNPMDITIQVQRPDMDSRNLSKFFCNSCHQEDVYDKFVSGTLHSRQEFTEDCLACHDEHEEADVECLECHKSGGFGGLADAPDHIAIAPYDECMDCHTQGHIPDRVNFTFYKDKYGTPIEDDFCVECHAPKKAELTDFGAKHESQDCSSCHETHEDADIDCLSCHRTGGIAPLPSHNIENQYEECLLCHESGHAPLNITFGVSNVGTDFCADISCHGGTDGIVNQFENYGGRHLEQYLRCTGCHSTHSVDITCKDAICHSSPPAGHTIDYPVDECLECHDTPHSPAKLQLRPGYNLTQRAYMSQYFVLDTLNATNSFSWAKRGNHSIYSDCFSCHSDAETSIYTPSAQILMNVSGTDCSENCHSWIDPISSGDPYNLLTSATEWVNHTVIFDNATYGGCAGKCHQNDVTNPVYDGTGHGIVSSCLIEDCHGSGYPGKIHDDHINHLVSTPGVSCEDVCHDLDPLSYKAPINGGCYDCHKSGHDPSIMDTSPCYICHSSNLPNQD